MKETVSRRFVRSLAKSSDAKAFFVFPMQTVKGEQDPELIRRKRVAKTGDMTESPQISQICHRLWRPIGITPFTRNDRIVGFVLRTFVRFLPYVTV